MSYSHSILLFQENKDPRSKRYDDFKSLAECLDCEFQVISALQNQYEQRLKHQRANQAHVTYNLDDIVKYIDSMHDMGILMYSLANTSFDQQTAGYLAHDKNWIKQKLTVHLKRKSSNKA